MDIEQIFLLQMALSLLVVGLVAVWKVGPWLNTLPTRDALFWLTLPHAFRHIGLVFLVPGVVSPEISKGFSGAAGYGDLAAGLLAIVSLIALSARWWLAWPLLWILSVVGMVDLANALRQAENIPHLWSSWYIPTFIVPVLLVSHVLTVLRLVRGAGRARRAEAPAN